MRLFLKIVYGSLFLFGQQLAAQDILSVEDAIQAALKSNFEIELARVDSSGYAIDKAYSNTLFLPTLNGTASRVFNNNNQNQKLSDGSIRERNGIKSNNLAASVNLSWRLFDGLRMFATRQKLTEFQRLGELAVKDQIVTSVASVINSYYDVVRQKQQLKAIEEQISINDERVQLAERRFSVGLGAKPELLQAKVDLNAQRAARLTQETLIAQLKEQLNRLIGFPTTRTYEVSDSIPFNPSLQIENIRNDLEITNPTLQVAKKNIDISRLTLKEIRADFYPVVALNTAYNFTRTNNAEVINTFTPLFNQNKGFNYGLSVNVPILRF